MQKPRQSMTAAAKKRLLDGAAFEFIRNLKDDNYGEAALTALGAKPAAILPVDGTCTPFLAENPLLVRRAGMDIINATVNGRRVFLLLDLCSIGKLGLNAPAVKEIVENETRRKNEGGRIFGYPQTGISPADHSAYMWMAFSNLGHDFVTHYMGFSWDIDPAIDPWSIKFVREISELCLMVESIKGKCNLIELNAFSKNENGRLTASIKLDPSRYCVHV